MFVPKMFDFEASLVCYCRGGCGGWGRTGARIRNLRNMAGYNTNIIRHNKNARMCGDVGRTTL